MISRTRAREEGGWALVTAVILLSVMMAGGLAFYSIVDTQTNQSRIQRNRETAFNMAEAALNAQVYDLARDWPGKGMATNPYPTCGPSSTSSRCPSNSQLVGAFSSSDAAGATWSTSVRDNAASPNFYSDAVTASQPGYDSNGDGKVWVRASASAKGKTRTLVALVRAEEQPEDLPHNALITGRLDMSNNGNKTVIDASASTASPAVAVRCTPQMNEATPCLGYNLGSGNTKTLDQLYTQVGQQLTPNLEQTGYTGGNAMSAAAQARLKARAIADGTYYTSCPPASGLTGAVVYIESGNCSYTSNNVWNTADSPGLVIMASGTMYIGGTSIYYGIIYASNGGNSSGDVVQVQGNARIIGGVLVDGNAITVTGSSKVNVTLDPNAYNKVASYGSAGVIQNTWREIS